MICTPGRGNVNTTSQYLTAITIIWQHPVHPKLHYDPNRTADEMRSTPGFIQENSPESIPQPDGSYDGSDVDRDKQPDADTSVEQLDPMPTNPAAQNTIYGTTRSQIVMTTTDTDSVKQLSTERIRTLSGNPRNARCGKPTYSIKHLHGPVK